jgi:hypothetical protein
VERDEALRPLSRDHQVALAVALRLRRCDESTAAEAAARFAGYFEREGRRHFRLEEELLVPELGGHPGDAARVLADHAAIRAAATDLADGAPAGPGRLHELGTLLDDHVRFEERSLFPLLEAELAPDRLAAIGAALDHDDA